MSPRGKRLQFQERAWRLVYILWDAVAAGSTYTLLYDFRKRVLEPKRFGIESLEWQYDTFWVGLLATMALWVFTMWMVGTYTNPLRKSRLKEMGRIVQTALVFGLSYFFLFLLDDFVKGYQAYLMTFSRFTISLMLFTLLGRILIATFIRARIRYGQMQFPILLIGSHEFLDQRIKDIRRHARSSGEMIIGWVNTQDELSNLELDGIPSLDPSIDVLEWIEKHNIEDCIVAIPSNAHDKLTPIMLDLERSGCRIFMFPDTYGIISGQVALDAHGVPLVEWHVEPMTPWQRHSKRLVDIGISVLVLILLAPLFVVIAALVKRTKGPVFYRQERLGRYEAPFHILKFRSMISDAEASGPQMSQVGDPRITNIGRILRKYRLDELPQFWNVLKGEMSLVGPRPERAFYAKQIIDQAPQYRHIYKVQPGITSWGMVRYGYAVNVDEMIERMAFDLIYIENMTFFNDVKVLIYTVWTIINGRGQ